MRVRRVILQALEEAISRNTGYVGTEHFLLALLRENECAATHILQAKNVSIQQIRETVETDLERRRSASVISEPRLTATAKSALQAASLEARSLQHDYIGTGHLLLGLLQENDTNLAKILKDSGLNLESARQRIKNYRPTDIEDSTPAEPIDKRNAVNNWDCILFFGSAGLFLFQVDRVLRGQYDNYRVELSVTVFCASLICISIRDLLANTSWKMPFLLAAIILLMDSLFIYLS